MSVCAECRKEFRRRQYSADFCCGTCRRVFNNRRQVRGAALYDLTMIVRYASDAKARTVAQAALDVLSVKWEKEDGGAQDVKPRRTWQRPAFVLGFIY